MCPEESKSEPSKNDQLAPDYQIQNLKKLKDAFLNVASYAKGKYFGLASIVSNSDNERLCFDHYGFSFIPTQDAANIYFCSIAEKNLTSKQATALIEALKNSASLLPLVLNDLEQKRNLRAKEQVEINNIVANILSCIQEKEKSETEDLAKF
jgi:hypothetical protein